MEEIFLCGLDKNHSVIIWANWDSSSPMKIRLYNQLKFSSAAD